mgnify:CR=1 FL=1
MPLAHEIRTNNKTGRRKVKTTPQMAIKLFCIECMGFQRRLVKECKASLCPLHPYREGRNPGLRKRLSKQAREMLQTRLKTPKALGKKSSRIDDRR